LRSPPPPRRGGADRGGEAGEAMEEHWARVVLVLERLVDADAAERLPVQAQRQGPPGLQRAPQVEAQVRTKGGEMRRDWISRDYTRESQPVSPLRHSKDAADAADDWDAVVVVPMCSRCGYAFCRCHEGER